MNVQSNYILRVSVFMLIQTLASTFSIAQHADPTKIYDDARWLYEHHLYDVDYPAEEIEEMFIAADDIFAIDRKYDKHYAGPCDCWRFQFGVGVRADERRAFDCAQRCDDKWLLAHYYVNGGPVAVDRGRAILLLMDLRDIKMDTKTYWDFKNYEFSEADAHAQIERNRKRIDNIIMEVALGKKVEIANICQNEATPTGRHLCEAKDFVLTEGRLYWAHRDIYKSLDPEGKRLFAYYVRAFDAYRSWRQEYIRESEFTDRGLSYTTYLLDLLKAHETNLASLFNYKPKWTADNFKEADEYLNDEYQLAMNYYKHVSGPRSLGGYLRVAQRRWINYRDASAALFAHVNQASFSPKVIASDIKARLSQERANELSHENLKEDRYSKYEEKMEAPTYAEYVKSLGPDFERNLKQVLLLKEKIKRKNMLVGGSYPGLNEDYRPEEEYTFFEFHDQENWNDEKARLQKELNAINKFTSHVTNIFNDAGKVYSEEALEKYEFARATQTNNTWLLAHYYINGGPVAVDRKKAVRLLRQFVATMPKYSCIFNPQQMENLIKKINDGKAVDLINIQPCEDGSDTVVYRLEYRNQIQRPLIFLAVQEQLNEEGKKLFFDYTSAFQEFAVAHAHFWGRDEREGYYQYYDELTEQNTSALLSFLSYHPTTTVAELMNTETELKTKYKEAFRSHEYEEDTMRELQKLWIHYRDAEVALFVHAKGKEFSPELITAEVKARLNRDIISKWYYY
jgi:uncharacterized protein YecT (DUF1311 family)